MVCYCCVSAARAYPECPDGQYSSGWTGYAGCAMCTGSAPACNKWWCSGDSSCHNDAQCNGLCNGTCVAEPKSCPAPKCPALTVPTAHTSTSCAFCQGCADTGSPSFWCPQFGNAFGRTFTAVGRCYADQTACDESCGGAGVCTPPSHNASCGFYNTCPSSASYKVSSSCAFCSNFSAHCSSYSGFSSAAYCKLDGFCYPHDSCSYDPGSSCRGHADKCVPSGQNCSTYHVCPTLPTAPMPSTCAFCRQCSNAFYCRSTSQCFADSTSCAARCGGEGMCIPPTETCDYNTEPTAGSSTQTSCAFCTSVSGLYCPVNNLCYANASGVSGCHMWCTSNFDTKSDPLIDYCVSSRSSCSTCGMLPSDQMTFAMGGRPQSSCQQSSASSCTWCDNLPVCVANQTECASCYTLPESSCRVLVRHCQWSASLNCCVRVNDTRTCAALSEPSMCARGRGCEWCADASSCIDPRTTNCTCPSSSTSTTSSCKFCQGCATHTGSPTFWCRPHHANGQPVPQQCFVDQSACNNYCGVACAHTGSGCRYNTCPASLSPTPTSCSYCFSAVATAAASYVPCDGITTSFWCRSTGMCYVNAAACDQGCGGVQGVCAPMVAEQPTIPMSVPVPVGTLCSTDFNTCPTETSSRSTTCGFCHHLSALCNITSLSYWCPFSNKCYVSKRSCEWDRSCGPGACISTTDDCSSYNTAPSQGHPTNTSCEYCGWQSRSTFGVNYWCRSASMCYVDQPSCDGACGGVGYCVPSSQSCDYNKCPAAAPQSASCPFCTSACGGSWCSASSRCYSNASECFIDCASGSCASTLSHCYSKTCPKSSPVITTCDFCASACGETAWCRNDAKCYGSPDACHAKCPDPSQCVSSFDKCDYNTCPSTSSPSPKTTCNYCTTRCGSATVFCNASSVCYPTMAACHSDCDTPSFNCIPAGATSCSNFNTCPSSSPTNTSCNYCAQKCTAAHFCTATNKCYPSEADCNAACTPSQGATTNSGYSFCVSSNSAALCSTCGVLPSSTMRFNGEAPKSSCQQSSSSSQCSWCGDKLPVCADNPSECSACYTLPESSCHTLSGTCRWCSTLGTCLRRNDTCSCPFLPTSSDCSRGAGCEWCASTNLCVDSKSTNCSLGCYSLTSDLCSRGAGCEWCSRTQLCVNPNTTQCNLGCYNISADVCELGSCRMCNDMSLCVPNTVSSCECESLDSQHCALGKNCGRVSAVLDVPSAKDYCGPSSAAACPPATCAAVSQGEAACKAAGCNFNNGLCKPATNCISLLLPSLLLLPLGVVIIGAFKDIITLLLVGAFGDYFKRRVQFALHKLKHMCGCCSCCGTGNTDRRIDILEKTVYMNDPVLRRGCDFNYEQYVSMVATALFDVSDDVASVREDAQQLLFDAVALALADTNTWVWLPGLQGALASPKASSLSLSSGEPGTAPSGFTKKRLTADDFSSRRALLNAVEDQLEQTPHTSSVFYAGSSDRYKNIAVNLVSFPTSLQLGWYTVNCVLMMLTTLYSVFFTNRSLIEHVAENSCSSGTGSVGTGTTTAAPSTTTTTVASASFFLIAARLANTSLWSTAFLVFVKAARAIYHLRSEDFSSMPLAERLPVISLASRLSLQIVLFLYTLLILPFAALGITYGWAVGAHWEAPLPGLLALIFVFLLVALLRRFGSHIKARNDVLSSYARDTGDAAPGSQRASAVSLIEMASAPGDGHSFAFTAFSAQQDDGAEHDERLLGPTGDDNDDSELSPREESSAPLPTAAAENKEDVDNTESTSTNNNNNNNSGIMTLLRPMLSFLLNEELPLLILSIGFQLAVSYTVLLHWSFDFALSGGSGDTVFTKDWKARTFKCYYGIEVQEASHALGIISSYLPFS